MSVQEPEWIGLEDVPYSIADIAWLNAQENGDAPAVREPLRIVPFGDFVAVEEETAEPLLGTPTETLLPADGMLLMYGDGGAGKTTLTIDATVHLGSGTNWLGIEIARPVTVTLIENEGPRGKFRQVLAEKMLAWEGPSFGARVHVLEEPWTRFTLQDAEHRIGLTSHITSTNTDVVIMGPLATLGMIGGGTPDEISAFERLLRETRTLLERPVAFWIVHHENKAGDVSGAWERVPDTLCHVQAQGNGHTRLVWRKARWSSESHGTSLDLVWREGRTFGIREDESIDHHAELLKALAEEWVTVKEAAKLIGRKEAPTKQALSDLVRRGELEFQIGPPGRGHRAHCFRTSTAPNARAQYGAVRPLEGLETGTAPLRPPYRETVGSSAVVADPYNSADKSGAVEDDDDIPF